MLLMLEDDAGRVERFTATLRAVEPNLPLQVWRDAPTMIREVVPLLQSAKLISLDHDLETGPDGLDPGDGLAVAKFLVSRRRFTLWHRGSRLLIWTILQHRP
jgi:hypothetical protein